MAEDTQPVQLRSYLAGQSAKRSATEIGQRLDEAAAEFLAAVERAPEAIARTAPAPGEWSVAEIVDHVALTLDDALGIMKALARGERPAAMAAHPPASAARPLRDLLDGVRARQAAAAAFLAAHAHEPNVDVRVRDDTFGDLNWKGYALILRLHYRDHAEQVRRTVAALASGSGGGAPS
jgi:hypothetical protein